MVTQDYCKIQAKKGALLKSIPNTSELSLFTSDCIWLSGRCYNQNV